MPDINILSHNSITYENVVKDFLRLGREIGEEGFPDLSEPEVLELIKPKQDQLTAQEIEEMLKELPQDDEKTGDEPILHLSTVTRALTTIQKVIEDMIENDPNMTRSLKFKQDCEKAVHDYQILVKML